MNTDLAMTDPMASGPDPDNLSYLLAEAEQRQQFLNLETISASKVLSDLSAEYDVIVIEVADAKSALGETSQAVSEVQLGMESDLERLKAMEKELEDVAREIAEAKVELDKAALGCEDAEWRWEDASKR